MTLVSDMTRAVIEYALEDKEAFARQIQDCFEKKQSVDEAANRKHAAICEKRIGELEILIAKIYEDNALGKLSDKRYDTLSNQYEAEQAKLTEELEGYKDLRAQTDGTKDASKRFLALVERYTDFDEISTTMLNEFVDKIVVHERDRKGSVQTTQKIEIHFNLIGQFVPPAMVPKEPTPEELEELRKIEEIKDRRHQQYLARKASGKQKEYDERYKAKKKARMDAKKEDIRAEDRKNGIYYHLEDLPEIPRARNTQTAAPVKTTSGTVVKSDAAVKTKATRSRRITTARFSG